MSFFDFSTTRDFNRFGISIIYTNLDTKLVELFIPFYQNPKITETKRAKFVQLSPINSNNQINIYTGSESRTFRLEMGINFLHLINSNLIGLKQTLGGDSWERRNNINGKIDTTEFRGNVRSALVPHDMVHKAKRNRSNPVPANYREFINGNEEAIKGHEELFHLYLLVINTLRMSTINNPFNPLLGPPVLKIRYGNMYDNIVCFVKSVSINDSEVLYDIATGIPLNLVVSFDLVENNNNDYVVSMPTVSVTSANGVTTFRSVALPDDGQTEPRGQIASKAMTERKNISKKTEESIKTLSPFVGSAPSNAFLRKMGRR